MWPVAGPTLLHPCDALTRGSLIAAASTNWAVGREKLQVASSRRVRRCGLAQTHAPSAELGGEFDKLSGSFIGSARRESDKWEGVELNLLGGNGSDGVTRKSGGKKSSKQAPRPSPATKDLPPPEQRLTVQATSRGRAGKTVTVIAGLQLTPESLQTLAKKLKALLGTGGAVKDNTIEIQGNHSAKLTEELNKMGYKATKSGK